jgi:hypothetical protein
MCALSRRFQDDLGSPFVAGVEVLIPIDGFFERPFMRDDFGRLRLARRDEFAARALT